MNAIYVCASHLIREKARDQTIYICEDSNSALKAIGKVRCSSKIVAVTKEKLNELGTSSKVILRWVPAHCGIHGNELADLCAKTGAASVFIGPEPYSGVPWSMITANMKKLMFDERVKYWSNLEGHETAKLLIGGINKAKSKKILKLSRKEMRLLIGFLSGHYPTNARINRWNQSHCDKCRFCEAEPEKIEHLLCVCYALARKD